MPEVSKLFTRQLSPLAVQMNIFAQLAACSCVIPYISVYLPHYIGATQGDVGTVILISNLLGLVLNLCACSSADRYRCHRTVYLMGVLALLCSTGGFFLPIYYKQTSSVPQTDNHDTANESLSDTPSPLPPSCFWYYFALVMATTMSMAMIINMNLADSFCANIANKCNQTYGSIRFWGSVGWASSSLLLCFINNISWLPFLVPALLLSVSIAFINVLLIVFWPDPRPFDLSEKIEVGNAVSNQSKRDVDLEFHKGWTTGLMDSTLASCKHDPKMTSDGHLDNVIERHRPRKTSLNTQERPQFRSTYSEHSFEPNVTTKTETCHEASVEKQSDTAGNPLLKEKVSMAYKSGCIDKPDDSGEMIVQIDQVAIEISGTPCRKQGGFRLHFKVVTMIASRNKLFIRFLILYVISGFAVAMNWSYLFPYMKHLDRQKFPSLSAAVMIAGYSSETIFYYISPRITKSISHRTGLSVVLLVFGLRYSLYLLFSIFRNTLPLDYMILVELLQSVNIGLFNCVFNESSSKFAHEAGECVPDLIKLGYIDDEEETVNKIKNGFKTTMVGISSCCFDGIGVAFGSLIGGLIIDAYGYEVLWISTISIVIVAALINCR